MKLVFETEGDFIIKNGGLSAQDGTKFTIEKSEREIVVTDSFSCGTGSQYNDFRGSTNHIAQNFGSMSMISNGISINNGTVYINGFKVKVNKGIVTIDGCAAEIIYNGQNLLASSNCLEKEDAVAKEDLKENEHMFYSLSGGCIDVIMVNNCGGLFVEDASVLSIENLSLSVKGSSDISLNTGNKENINNISASVMGSGDITLVNLRTHSFNASVMGSGDIRVKQSKFTNASLSVMGSGDIAFKESTVDNVNKSIMGSGDINGI